ncbi:MAG TPA: hypothetical protein VJ327_01875 [Patescibacteria group bacterium]|nr:MAG: hypothetical protein UX14_C0023G0004 [Parcubacteria group bacterium GW2011_GWF1_45_5]HJZ04594.1 hypothetical protein [Patescibacteria group bacterium]
MDEDTEPQEVMDEVQESPEIEQSADAPVEQEKMVPLSALQKERAKRHSEREARQRAEVENQYLKEQRIKPEPKEEDESQYEAPTKAEVKNDISRSEAAIVRKVQESLWISQNPEKSQYIEDNLETFLKQRPNLRNAIGEAQNRYEEAYLLMNALTPKQRQELKPKVEKKPVAGSPGGIPKAAALNDAVDVMSMSDDEYRTWRTDRKKRR